jgi:uncharacterized protein with FMN-binding domain
MPKDRMHRGLVALSASAVAAIYLAGYAHTQPADADFADIAPPPPTITLSPTAAATLGLSPSLRATPTPQPQPIRPPVARATATAVPGTSYKDGTYSGMGSSRRGNVWVSVTVTNGRIGSVTITRSTLQYPVRDIAGLPAQVVQRQGAQVDIVSGATYSSQAFRTATSQALAQAQAA